MDVLPGDEGPKHPVLASVLMGIIRALNDDSTGPSSSSDDNITCRSHDRRQPPCRRRIHQKSPEVETDKAQEYVLPPVDECLSPTEDPPILDPIRSATESPKLHTILETDEEGKEERSKQEDRWIKGAVESVEEKRVHTRDRDAIKHLQRESVRACSSTSSPLVTSDDSDVAAFLSKHEYATLFGDKGGNTDKILIPSRFVQDYGETSTSGKTNYLSPLKRSSKEELKGAQSKKQKADDTLVESPPKTPKRKLESLLNDAVQEFDPSVVKSDQDTTEVSGHDSSSWDRETDVQNDTYETGSSIELTVFDSHSQPKRFKTSDEENEVSSGETLFSDRMSDDTMEESTGSSVFDNRQVEALGRRKKKLTKTLKSLRIDSQDIDGMSDFSSDGQTGTLKPSMTRTMPGPKVRLGNYGWTAAKNDAKSMLQKAVSTSLEDFIDVVSPDHQFSTAYSDSRGGKTDASDTIGSGSIRQVSKIDGSNVSNIAASDPSELLVDPSSKSSPVTLSVDDMSESKYKGEISDTSFTSIDFKSVSSSVSSPKIQTSNAPTEGTSEITNENAHQEYISSINESHSTVTDLGHIESSILTGTEMYSGLGSVVTSSDKLYTDSTQSSEQKSVLQSSDVSSKQTSPTSEESVISPATQTRISYGSNDSSLSHTTELNESVDAFPSGSFALNTMSRSGTSFSKQSGIEKSGDTEISPATQTSVSFASNDSSSIVTTELSDNTDASSSDSFVSSLNTTPRSGIDPRALPAILRTGTEQPLNNSLKDLYAPPMYSDATSNTSSNASTYMQDSSKTDESSRTLNIFQPSSDVNSSSITSTSAESSAVTASEATTLSESSGDRRSKSLYDVNRTSIASSSSADSSAVTASEATTLTESSEDHEELRSKLLSDVASTSIASSSAKSSALTASEATILTESSENHRKRVSKLLSDVTSTSIASSSAETSALTASEATTLSESSRDRGSKSLYDVNSTSIASSSAESSALTASEATTLTESSEDHGELRSKPIYDVTSTSITSSFAESRAVTASEATTLTESSADHGEHGSKQSGSFESSNYSSDYTTGGSTYLSSLGTSIITSLASQTGEDDSTNDFAEDTHVPLSNINLTDALLRDDPSLSYFDDSDALTSSSDEYITHRLMKDTLDSHDRGFPKGDSIMKAESTDIPPNKAPVVDNDEAPIEETPSMTVNENEVKEGPFMRDVHSEYLPVLLEEENEESSGGSHTQIEKDYVNDEFADELEISNIEETSTLQQPSPMVSSSEISTLNDNKTDDEHTDRLLIDLGDNEKAFDDILITNDTSHSSLNSEYLPYYDHKPENVLQPLSSTSSECKDTDIDPMATTDEYTVIDFSYDVAHYVIVNAVATVFTEIIVNVAITRIMVEQDLALQMERALFPGIEVDAGDKTIHWISPARYRREKYAASLEYTESLSKQIDSEDKGEAFSLCLERAFFPCLADSEESSTRVSSSRSESTYHSLPENKSIANGAQTDEKLESTTSKNVITIAYSQVSTIASRVSAIAVSSVSQMWSIMTHLSWTIWNNIRGSFPVSKMQRRDEATQYDYTVTTVDKDSGRSQREMMNQTDDVNLHILASRIVTSAVTRAAWGKEYAMSSEQSFPHETSSYISNDKEVASEPDTSIVQLASSVVEDVFSRVFSKDSETRADSLSTTPPNGMILAAQKSEEDCRLRLSASAVVETAVSNALVIHDSIRGSPSATPTELSTQSENMSVSSERSSIDDAISACSLSDIPLSSITFMRQQLADMRAIFQDTIAETMADLSSKPALAPISTTDPELTSSHWVSSVVPLEAEDEVSATGESISRLEEETATADEGSIDNADIEKTTIRSNELDESLTAITLDSNDNTSELVLKEIRPSSGKEVESYEKSNEVETEIVDSTLEGREDEPSVSDLGAERINKSGKLLPELSLSEQQDEEIVNPNDTQESDSSSTSSSALSLSDVPLSGISYIREQLSNVKSLANSIMDDFNSYAKERALVAKRSSQLTCSSASVRSHSSCDSTRTIGNNSSNSSICLNLNGESNLDENRKSSSDKQNSLLHEDAHELAHDAFVHQEKGKVFPRINESLEKANENGNAKTHNDDRVAQSDTKNERELQLAHNANETLERQPELDGEIQRHSERKATKEAVFKSSHMTEEADGTRTVQMTKTHQTRQLATFSRNSPSRRHVISRRKGADHPHGSYSGESTCSTDCSSSIVSRSTSSFSDGTMSSGSKKVTIESESQSKGRTDVSCRISDRGIWVNTAFFNEIYDDSRSTSITAENADEKYVKNKIKVNVKVSPSSRKKHHSHRVRSRVRDTQLHGTPVANQKALTVLDNETLVKNRQEVRVNEVSVKTRAEDSRTAQIQAYDELTDGRDCRKQSNRSSFKHEVSDIHNHRAVELLNKVTPKKNSSLETQCSDMSEKIEETIDLAAGQIHTKRECLSDGAVSEHHQFLSRKQFSLSRKSRETKPQDSACHSCVERRSHPDDLLAAPVISRSERTRAVLSMLDDVADNLSLDSSVHDSTGRTHTTGGFRKLFASRKNKRRNRDKTPDQSPRVLSDSSVTGSDCESGSPDYSSDSSRTPRSHSAASLLSNVLRNLSVKRSKKRSKGASSSTPNGSRVKKGSVPAFDEMLGDLDDDCFIDDAFPKLVSTRDSPSEDNTSLNEVLQDLIEEWSFEGLEETLDFTPKSFVDRIREKLNLFMAEVRKEKRKAELRFGRDGKL